MSKEQAILEKSLGKLLGTEDGTSDFFHHLVTIESKDVSKDATAPNGGNMHIWGDWFSAYQLHHRIFWSS
jgi:hypothetical protein